MLTTADLLILADAFQLAVDQYAAIVNDDSGVPPFREVSCIRAMEGVTIGTIIDELVRIAEARQMCMHLGLQDNEIAFFVHE